MKWKNKTKQIYLIIFLITYSISILSFMPKTQAIEHKYTILCTYNNGLSDTFRTRCLNGKITQFYILYAHWDNQILIYDHSDSEWENNFINPLKAVIPTAKIWAWVYSYPPFTPADVTTDSKRTALANQLLNVAYKSYINGILDDNEHYTGTLDNLLDYFNKATNLIEPIKPIHPWIWYSWMPYLTAKETDVGAYGTHVWSEANWKSRLDYCQANANIGFSWFVMSGDESASGITLAMQLNWFDEKNGWLNSKLTTVGIYWYNSMSDNDWLAWNTWVNSHEIPPPPSLLPFADGFETGDFTEWSGTWANTGCSVTRATDVKLNGSYSAKFVLTGVTGYYSAHAWKTFSSQFSVYERFYVNLPTLPTINKYHGIGYLTDWIDLRDIIALAIVNIGGNYYVRARNLVTSTNYDSSAISISINTWYKIQVHLNISNTLGAIELWLDGIGKIFAYGLDTNYGNTIINTVVIGVTEYNDEVNTKYFDDVKVSSTYIEAPPTDYFAVAGSYSVSTTIFNQSAIFTCVWMDDYGLSHGLLSHNETGTWTNNTLIALSGKNYVFSDTWVLPSSIGFKFYFRFYANDSINQWTVTPIYLLLVTDVIPSEFYYIPMPTDYSLLSSGNFKLQLFRYGTIGVQEETNYFEIELLSDNALDCGGSINQLKGSGTFTFTSNTNGTMEINSNIMDAIQVKINSVTYSLVDNAFDFNQNDVVSIVWYWGENPYLASWIQASIGLIGLGMIGVSPLISYYLGYKRSDGKIFAFAFIEVALLLLGLGLLLGFIYA